MSLPASGDRPVLLHNPRCSKSRQAKALLEERNVDFALRLYLEDPLDAEELRALTERLGRSPGEWVRRKEQAFADAGLDASASDDELRAAMVAAPILMERPILVTASAAAVGRPPEEILGILRSES